AVLLDPSVAVHVTVVVPNGNIEPAGGLHVTVTVEQLSEAVGVANSTGALVANGHEAWAATVIGLTHPLGNAGGWLSLTTTVKLQLTGGPPLEAMQTTVVTPFGNTLPDTGEQLTVGGGTSPAVTVNVTCAP